VIDLPAEPMTWVATGDSITQGVLHPHGARGRVEHVHERVRWQLDRLTDVVINTGVSAWRARFPDADPIPWLDNPAHPNAAGHLQMADHTLRTLGLGELTDL